MDQEALNSSAPWWEPLSNPALRGHLMLAPLSGYSLVAVRPGKPHWEVLLLGAGQKVRRIPVHRDLADEVIAWMPAQLSAEDPDYPSELDNAIVARI